jgi:hypothetical protein
MKKLMNVLLVDREERRTICRAKRVRTPLSGPILRSVRMLERIWLHVVIRAATEERAHAAAVDPFHAKNAGSEIDETYARDADACAALRRSASLWKTEKGEGRDVAYVKD